MNMKIAVLLTTWFATYNCQNIYQIFESINQNYLKFNSIAAEISWNSSIGPSNTELQEKAADYQKNMLLWQHRTCGALARLENRHLLTSSQQRQTYLLCRGPKYTYGEARIINYLYDELQSSYSNIEVCINTQRNITKDDHAAKEAAILNYLSNTKQLLKVTDVIPLAAKMAGNGVGAYGALCFNGENEFENMMEYSRDPNILKWLWLVWREKIVTLKEPFIELVTLENQGAHRNGYSDIGASWRDELEIPDLRQFCRYLYDCIRPFYSLLHGVVRFYLRERYGDVVPEKGPIPAHLVGNLWSHNWDNLIDLITPKSINLDANIKKLNWTVQHMVKRVEDFYQSMGLPAMTPTFWRESVFENKNGVTRCHGTAADMFKNGDYRLLYCSGTSMEDFYVLHHEFGHIHYYMAYADQPGLFRQANAALHESIGDAIMYGVMTPQHLHRLGLVNDSILYTAALLKSFEPIDNKLKNNEAEDVNPTNDNKITNKNYSGETDLLQNEINEIMKTNDDQSKEKQWDDYKTTIFENGFETKIIDNRVDATDDMKLQKDDVRNNINNVDESYEDTDLTTDDILLLKQALNKIPQIPFALVIDEYRWKYFEGGIDKKSLNDKFWGLTLELQGIAPPGKRDKEYFDAAAKFHVSDNTAYIRYFLSSFIQHQIFEALCRAAVFGRRDAKVEIPDTIALNRCDIYGSKAAGKLLKDFMSRGHSQHWREILQSTIGNTDISPHALQRYYRPLYDVLARIVKKKNIPLGW